MLRIFLLLLIAVLSPAVGAHEGSVSAPGSDDRPAASSAARDGESAAATERITPARGDSKLVPDINGELPASRSQSTRFHSFLPGMFR
ncbi:MAG: hypothetical protein ABIO84_02355 [Lysobacter sp.]